MLAVQSAHFGDPVDQRATVGERGRRRFIVDALDGERRLVVGVVDEAAQVAQPCGEPFADALLFAAPGVVKVYKAAARTTRGMP